MLLNTTVIYCLANGAGFSNGRPDCSNLILIVHDILGIEQSSRLDPGTVYFK